MRMRLLLGFLSVIVHCKGQFRTPEITEHPADLLVPKNEPATLYCHAEGRPTPTISWFKNGNIFEINAEGGRHVLLDSGGLFFLWVLQTKREDDSGLYWCQATNSVGTVRSKNATLEIAVLKEEFKEVPDDNQVAEGDTAILRCIPPRGHPNPVVVWTRDKIDIDFAKQHRYKLIDHGSLSIKGVRVSDSGEYTCKARNVYATRETVPVLLTVLVPPHLVSSSGEVTGASGGSLELVCRVGGDPPPEVFWERVPPGELPVERMTQEEGGQVLRIRHITPEDQGVYTCRAENPVGAVKENVSLVVHSRPVISVIPKDAKVGVNGTAIFECETSGSPPPMTYWTLEGKGVVLEAGQTWSGGRITIGPRNTLTVRRVVTEDGGYYVCTAVGIAGSALARAHLEVQGITDMPPPIIALGAPNQTLPLATEGDMPCVAYGSPEPKVQWFVGEKAFHSTNRSFVTPLGTLKITGLRVNDTGTYTCKASSASGVSEWTTSLIVANPTNPNVAFFKMPNEVALPEPPGHVTVQAVNMTTATLGWRRGRSGSSSVLGYTVQYWSPDIRGPWATASTRAAPSSVMPVSVIVTGLKPDYRYVFIVRASNSHGLSRPSSMTHIVRTLSSFAEGGLALQQIRARLTDTAIRLVGIDSHSTSSFRVKWHLRIDSSIIEGVYIRYRSLDEDKKTLTGALSVETVFFHNGSEAIPESHVVTGLQSGTSYEVFVVPFYRNIEGKPSASMRASTMQAKPAVAPSGFHYTLINNTAVRLTWDPIPSHTSNGRVTGYTLLVMDASSEKSLPRNITVMGTWKAIGRLTPGSSYRANVQGTTASGAGPMSPPITFSLPIAGLPPGPSIPSSNVDSNNYLIIVIACAALVLFGSLFVSVFFIYRRRRNSKCPYMGKGDEKSRWSEYPRYWDDTGKGFGLTGTLHTDIISQGASVTQFYQRPPTDGLSKEVYERKNISYDGRTQDDLYEDPEGLRLVCFTECPEKRCSSPAPYATTTLISDDRHRMSSDLLNRLPPNIPIEGLRLSQGASSEDRRAERASSAQADDTSEYSYNFNTSYVKDLSPRQMIHFTPDGVGIRDDQLSDLTMSSFNPDFSSFLMNQEDPFLYTCPSTGSFKSHGSTFGRPVLLKTNTKGINPALIPLSNNKSHFNIGSQSANSLDNSDSKRISQLNQQQRLLKDINNYCTHSPNQVKKVFSEKNPRPNFHSQPLLSGRVSPRSSTFGDSEGSECEEFSTSSCSSKRPTALQHSDDSYQAGLDTDWGCQSESQDDSAFTTGLSDADAEKTSTIHRRQKKYSPKSAIRNSMTKAMTSPLI